MGRKRAALSGQGKKLFESTHKPQASPDVSSGKKQTSASKPSSEAPPDLAKKIEAIKTLVKRFKQLVDPAIFNELRVKDLPAFTERKR